MIKRIDGQSRKVTEDHYGPSLLTKRFADADGRLWYFNREHAEKGVEQKRPEKVFYERHFDSSPDRAESNQEWFNKDLETPFSNLLDKLLPKIRRGIHPGLSAEEKHLLMRFSFVQYKRRPELLEDLISEESHIRAKTTADLSSVDTSGVRMRQERSSQDDKDFLHEVRRRVISNVNPEAVASFDDFVRSIQHIVSPFCWLVRTSNKTA